MTTSFTPYQPSPAVNTHVELVHPGGGASIGRVVQTQGKASENLYVLWEAGPLTGQAHVVGPARQMPVETPMGTLRAHKGLALTRAGESSVLGQLRQELAAWRSWGETWSKMGNNGALADDDELRLAIARRIERDVDDGKVSIRELAEWRRWAEDLSGLGKVAGGVQGDTLRVVITERIKDPNAFVRPERRPDAVPPGRRSRGLINLTPHDVTIEEGPDRGHYPSTGVARVEPLPMGDVVGLPAPAFGIRLIVSVLVAERLPNRRDLVVPGEQLRDEAGRIVGARDVQQPPDVSPALAMLLMSVSFSPAVREMLLEVGG